MFYEMLYGKVPWKGKSPFDLVEKIEKLELLFPETPVIDSNIKILIKKLLTKEEKDRISWEDLFNQSIL